MKYLSVCSGIEAVSCAWHDLDLEPLAFSEIELFPRAVLAHHYPQVPLFGDFTELQHKPWIGDADILVGGTPCQAFSVAGLRGSLSDDRGNLSLQFVRLANAIDDLRHAAGREPGWVLWENVPGVLSVSDNAFGAFLGGLVGHDAAIEPAGDRWADSGVVAGPQRWAAWRVLDAQHFGLAQRRKRVFVLARGGARGWAAADALLPLIESVRWHPAPRREAREGLAAGSLRSTDGGSDVDHAWAEHLIPEVSPAIKARDHKGPSSDGADDGAPLIPTVTHALRADGFDASEGGTGRGTPIVPVPVEGHPDIAHAICANEAKTYTNEGSMFQLRNVVSHPLPFDTTQVTSPANRSSPQPGDNCRPLAAGAHAPAIAFSCKDSGHDATDDLSPTLRAMTEGEGNANADGQVAVAFQPRIGRNGRGYSEDAVPALNGADAGATSDMRPCVATTSAVRRLTPRECERLQGFPDDWTLVPVRGKPAADGPRYKALGNSMAVPVMRYLGQRILEVEAQMAADVVEEAA